MNEPRYRFLEKLGEGGMGEVYLVEHLQLGRREALKILRGDLARDQRFVLRFRREARATHRVQHPNIVAVHDFGRLGDGRFFLAMEYVEGRRLDAVLKDSAPMPEPRALSLMVQLAGAVAHAHALGVVHRDLKPSNILVTTDARGQEQVKVLDFGIAKLVAPEAGDNTQLTLDGEVFGTPKYMAPELFIAGQVIDHRADVYALGCLAYEMLTGQPPFVGKRLEVMDAHLSKPPVPPTEKNPSIRPELERLILRCLEKSPKKRLQEAHDLHLALELMAGGGQKQQRRNEHESMATFSETRSNPAFETRADRESRVGHETRADDPRLRSITGFPLHDQARAAVEVATVELAEAVLALGHSGSELVYILVDVREADRDRERIIAEQHELEERTAALDGDARQRETALRFALAELEFDRVAVDPLSSKSDISRVSELEARLAQAAAERDQLQAALTERGIALATGLASLDERRAALYGSLGSAVDKAMGQFGDEPTLQGALERLRSVRDALKRSGPR